jgi:hypothetical protein
MKVQVTYEHHRQGVENLMKRVEVGVENDILAVPAPPVATRLDPT